MIQKRNLLKKGFTIVEAIIAATLLTVGIVALVATLVSSYSTASLSLDLSLANRVAISALEHLKSWNYETVYTSFQSYNSPTSAFKILEDGSIDWSAAINGNSLPADAVGYGYFTFVTQEYNYPATEWGTDTSFNPPTGGQIDLDGNGAIWTTSSITVGRTEGTTASEGYFVILPVKVTIVIVNRETPGNSITVERKTWIYNNNY
ncbi:MAG: type II secretion system protein [Planctomycetota bacterium]|nr:MAG: type II secretion system protein [Planctomycetota bacterium]